MPDDFYSMNIDDSALMFQGWGDELMYEQLIARKVTGILSNVINRSFGGKGVKIDKIWEMPGDKESPNMAKHLLKLKKFKELELNKLKANG